MTDFTYHRKAKENIGQGYLTNSKRPESFVLGVYPTHIVEGRGAKLYATDGNSYIDFICGLGTNILGYGHHAVSERVAREIKKGVSHSLATILEVQAAEKLRALFPFVDRVKFLKTGSEACSAAVRIARCGTGRKEVLTANYHGWSDQFIALEEPGLGAYTDGMVKFESINQIGRDTAAVIIEPIELEDTQDRRQWLLDVKARCEANGVVLIFDEVITGFRYPKFSVSRNYSIEPDLIVVGKAMANGFPLAAVGGKKDLMNGDYFVSSTYAGDTASISAFLAVANEMGTNRFDINTLWNAGEHFKEEFNKLSPIVQIAGYPTRGRFAAEPVAKALFFQECCKAGILFGPSWFYNFPLMEYKDQVLNVCGAVLKRIERGEVKLEGEMPFSPFAQRIRDRDNQRTAKTSDRSTGGISEGESASRQMPGGVSGEMQGSPRGTRRRTDKRSSTS